jgi:hypothetical protein
MGDRIYRVLFRRISLLTSLPVDKLDRTALENETRAIADQARSSDPLSSDEK